MPRFQSRFFSGNMCISRNRHLHDKYHCWLTVQCYDGWKKCEQALYSGQTNTYRTETCFLHVKYEWIFWEWQTHLCRWVIVWLEWTIKRSFTMTSDYNSHILFVCGSHSWRWCEGGLYTGFFLGCQKKKNTNILSYITTPVFLHKEPFLIFDGIVLVF